MLDYTPLHLAYAKPFIQKAEILRDKVDVSADRNDRNEEVVEFKFRIDMSYLLIINLILNVFVMFLMVLLLRK